MLKNIFIILSLFFTLAQAKELDKVTLQLKWKYQFQFAGFIVAKEKGFYKDVGLDVDIKEHSESTDTFEDMQEGKIQFGVSDSALILESIKGTPIVGMMPLYQSSPYVLMSKKSSGIKNLKDLDHKKIALYDDINGVAISSMLKAHHIQFIRKPVAYKLEKLKNNEIDAMIAYVSNEPFVAQEMGMEVSIIDPNDYGFERYGDILFTSNHMLDTQPELVERMYRASKKGFEYAFSHIDEVVELLYHKYNTLNKSKEALYYEANTLKKLTGLGENFGVFSKDKIESIAYIYSYTELGKYDLSHLDHFIYKPKKVEIDLTQEELDFIKDHPNIVLGSSSEFNPYVIVEKDGEIVGFDADVLNEINHLTGMNFSLKVGDWEQMQDEAKSSIIDGLSTGVVTKERGEYLNFSNVYTSVQIMVMTHIDNTSIKTFQDLDGKKIAISKHIASHKKAASTFKNATILEYDNVAEVMNSVVTGEADAMFGRSSLLYTSRVTGAPYLKLAMPLDSTLDLTFAVNKKFPLAVTIINKALNRIGKNKLLSLQDKWFLTHGDAVKIDLSQEEKAYLQENNVTYAGDPNWLPFEAFDKSGNYIGIIAEHIEIIENRLNIKFDKVITENWLDTLELSKTNKVDIISGDAADAVLNQNYKPIDTYIKNPLVIVTDKDHEYILDLNQIKDEKIAFISGAGYGADIAKKYPNIKFLGCETPQSGLLGVKTGKYDAFIGSLAMVEYTIVSMGIEDIKIAGQTDTVMNLTLFVDKNKPLLYSILNKSMKTISENRQHEIVSKWRESKVKKVIDYNLLWQVLTVFLILFLIGLFVVLTLRRSNKKLNQLLNSTIDAIGIFKDGKLIEVNDVFLELYGYNSLAEIKDKKAFNFVYKGCHQFLKEQLNDSRKPYELNMIKSDGTIFPALVRGTDIDSHTRISSVIDLSELKNTQRKLEELNQSLEYRVEQEVEKNRKQQELMMQKNRLAQMGEMLNSIAHQWRQPLNNINSDVAVISSVLAKDIIDRKILLSQIEKIENNTQYMSDTIEDFSNFFRPNKEKREFMLCDMVNSALELLAPRIKNVDIKIMHNKEVKLYSFKEEYHQVVMIILNNAIDNFESKRTQNPKIDIVIAEDKHTTYLSICDNGGGIKKENMDRIFDPYFTTKFSDEGVGLGLYMAKMLIEDSMQGKLEAANKNEGVCFEINIPKGVSDA